MHPCCLVPGWQTEHGVGNGQVVLGTEQEETSAVAFSYSMFSDGSRPGLVFIANTCIEVTEDDELL